MSVRRTHRLARLVVVGGVLAAGALVLGTGDLVRAAGEYAVSPTTVDFGTVAAGASVTGTVTISKVGGDPEVAPPAPVSDPPSAFSGLTPPFDLVGGTCTDLSDGFMDVGDSCDVTFEFAPSAAGSYSYSTSFEMVDTNTDERTPVTITLQGEAVQPVQATVTKSVAPALLDLSSATTADWTVTVFNAGSDTITAPQIVDDVPAGLTVDPVPAGCTWDGDVLDCAGPAILTGEQWELTYTTSVAGVGAFTNSATLTVGDGQLLDGSSTTTDEAILTAFDGSTGDHDVAITKRAELPLVAPGAPMLFEIDWRVVTGTAPGVTITDEIPTGLTVLAFGAGCSLAGSTLTCTVPGPLDAGEAGTFWVVVTSASAGVYDNTANLAAHPLDVNPANDSSSVSVEFALAEPCAPWDCNFDVAVAKSVSDSYPTLGEEVTFTLAWQVNGQTDVDGIVVFDFVPAGLSVVDLPAACTELVPQVIRCERPGTLSPGASGTFTIGAVATELGEHVNTAAVQTFNDLTDDNPANSISAVMVTVLAPDGDPCEVFVCEADVWLYKAAFPSPQLPPGATGGFVLLTQVYADPGAVVPTIRVVDEVPAGLTIVSAPGCAVAGQTLTCEAIGPFGDGEQVGFTVFVTSPVEGVFWNTAELDVQGWVDTNPDNNTSSATIEFTDKLSCTQVLQDPCELDVTVTKEVDNPTPNVGDVVTFTITVTNGTNSRRAVVNLYELVPDGLEFAGIVSSERVSSCVDFPGGHLAGALYCEFGEALDPGETDTTVVQMLVLDEGEWTNVAIVEATGNGRDVPWDNVATATVVVGGDDGPGDGGPGDGGPGDGEDPGDGGPRSDLEIDKEASVSSQPVGSSFSYRITYRNLGPDPATNVTVTDVVPSAFEILEVPESCTVTGQVVTCVDPGPVPANPSRDPSGDRVIEILVRATVAGQFVNEATVVGGQGDPEVANNTDGATVTIDPGDDPVPITDPTAPSVPDGDPVPSTTPDGGSGIGRTDRLPSTGWSPATAVAAAVCTLLGGLAVLASRRRPLGPAR